MNSLLIRIFLSFWLIIAITIGTAALGGYWYAERIRSEFENFDLGDTMLEASEALDQMPGAPASEEWLARIRRQQFRLLFLCSMKIGRICSGVMCRASFIGTLIDTGIRHAGDSNAILTAASPKTCAVRGHIHNYLVPTAKHTLLWYHACPVRIGLSGHVKQHEGIMLLLALISQCRGVLPVGACHHPTGDQTQGRNCVTGRWPGSTCRVAESLGDRRDELGLLARDFDSMAEQVTAHRHAANRIIAEHISHELRSPLARMRVALELAGKTGNPVSWRELDRIDDEAAKTRQPDRADSELHTPGHRQHPTSLSR